MKTTAFIVHALSPLHAGTGHTPDVIDLPIARMKATGIPYVPGSSIKGVLRDARRADREKTEAVFGPSDDSGLHAGAVVVGDARLLALPVRSFKGTFAWVSSPLLLELAKRDLGDNSLDIPPISSPGARVTMGSVLLHSDKKLYLEDIDLNALKSEEAGKWAAKLAPLVSPGDDIFTKRFAIVDDDTMTFLWETATQIDSRVRLDVETRTVANGALWLEESLPPESILVGLLGTDRSRRNGVELTPEQVLEYTLGKEEVLQFGGKASTGRGRCRVLPLTGGQA